jgi:hypothetical protein
LKARFRRAFFFDAYRHRSMSFSPSLRGAYATKQSRMCPWHSSHGLPPPKSYDRGMMTAPPYSRWRSRFPDLSGAVSSSGWHRVQGAPQRPHLIFAVARFCSAISQSNDSRFGFAAQTLKLRVRHETEAPRQFQLPVLSQLGHSQRQIRTHGLNRTGASGRIFLRFDGRLIEVSRYCWSTWCG